MLAVTTPRIDAPASRIGSGRDLGILAPLGILAAAVALAVALGQPQHFAVDQWFAMSTVEGVASYMPFATEADCRAATRGVEVACVAGADLNS